MSHENHEEQKEIAWCAEQHLIQEFLTHGAEHFTEHVEDLAHAFKTGEPHLCCMDEGTPYGIFRSAGSGILLEGAEREAFVQAMKEAGVAGIMSHEGCGAAALFAKQKQITDKTAEEVAESEARRLADELGVPYLGHKPVDRPKEFHVARKVYYDGTGRFNAGATRGKMPTGFVVSRRYLSPEQALREVAIAASIAFGAHGFGEKFSETEPFVLVPVGDPADERTSAEALAKELHSAIDQILALVPAAEGKLRVDGFDAPLPSDETGS